MTAYITTKQIYDLNHICEMTLGAIERDQNECLCIPYKKFEPGTRNQVLGEMFDEIEKKAIANMRVALKGKGFPSWIGKTLGRVLKAGRARFLGWGAINEICWFGQSDVGVIREISDDGCFKLNPNGERIW